LLQEANPIAPVMPVQGAKALKSLTRKGKTPLKIAAIMRPCEVRASIELSKLNQVQLDSITLISYDCPGAIPLSEYVSDPEKSEKRFDSILKDNTWDSQSTKPVCQMCDHFSRTVSDLHFGLLGQDQKSILIIPGSEKGMHVLEEMAIPVKEPVTALEKRVVEIKKQKTQKRAETYKVIKPMVEGFDNLLKTFALCIGCHNCQSACPICYCRQCYFESEAANPTSEVIFDKAQKRGGLSFPKDRIIFHTGRMAHMSLSCVSCGLCTDACPVSIPVAKIFSYVASQTQKTFEYEAGNSLSEALPMKEYKLDEIREVHELVKSAEEQESNDG